MINPEFEIMLYTDGGCSGNPGPGGWAYILKHTASGKEIEGFGANAQTTNNQMEMTAVIEGLKKLNRRTKVCVVTDSVYVKKGISEWIKNWKKNGWMRKDGKRWVPVKNADLWREMDELAERHDITFTWIKGHAGHPENERCDQLAVAAYQRIMK